MKFVRLPRFLVFRRQKFEHAFGYYVAQAKLQKDPEVECIKSHDLMVDVQGVLELVMFTSLVFESSVPFGIETVSET